MYGTFESEKVILVKDGVASSFLEANEAVLAVIEIWRAAKGRTA